jgi:hypothetical protein
MSFKTDEIDLICEVSVILQSPPDCYIDGLFVAFYTDRGEINLDFVKKEIQLVDFDYHKQTFLQILGLSSIYKMSVEDMYNEK